MGKLVAADRHHVALAEQDVTRLVHRVGEQKARELVSACLHLCLHRGVALELGLGDEGEERQHELVCRWHGRVRVDHGLVRVDAAGKVVHDHVVDVVLDVVGRVAVGDDLVVGDEHVRADAHVLELHAALERAKVVAQVQASRRPVSGEHGVVAGVLGQVCSDGIAAALGDLVASLVGHVFLLCGRSAPSSARLARA